MTSHALTAEEYLASVPAERQEAFGRLRQTLIAHLPPGFEEQMAYGMVSYVVPHHRYPAGYHCNPKQALPFISVANQKDFMALYHMGLYASPELLEWFTKEYPKHSKAKLDMGKSCIRFKKPDAIPFELIGALAGKMDVDQWVALYERLYKK